MSLSNDSPIEEPSEDKFGLDPFANSLAQSIANMSAPTGIVLAVNGPWGSGKSSAINLVKRHLKAQVDAGEINVIPFNPWWFGGGDVLTLSFFQHLNEAIGPSLPGRLRSSLSALGQGVSGVGAVAGALANLHLPGAGSVISGLAGLVGKATKQNRTVESEHRQISTELEKQNKRFLVIIDDIDRLNPDDVLTIFRLVKSVGRLPNVLYLLSFDRVSAERIVTERFPSEGVSYLDKIIQCSFDVPPPLPDLLRQQAVSSAIEIMGEPEERLHVRWWNVFMDVIAPTIQTPRDVIRLANQLTATWPAVAGNVDRADFFAITALQLGEPAIYNAIRKHQSDLCGGPDRNGNRGRNLTQIYDDLFDLANYTERKAQQLRTGLRRLFPRLDAVWGNTYRDAENWRQQRLIASTEHFRSYFTFGVSDDVLAAKELDELIARADDREFIELKFRAALGEKRRSGGTAAALMLDELTVHASAFEADKIGPFIQTLFSIADELDVAEDRRGGFDIGDNSLRIQWLLNRLVQDRFNEEQRGEIYFQSMPDASLKWSADFAERCHRYYEPREEGERDPGEPIVSQPFAEQFKSLALAKIRAASRNGALIAHPKITELLFEWLRLNDRDAAEVRAWTDEALADPAFLLAMAASAPSQSWSHGMGLDGMGDRVSRRSVRVDLEPYANILDVDRFERRLREAIDGEEVVGEDAEHLRHFLELPRGRHDRR